VTSFGSVQLQETETWYTIMLLVVHCGSFLQKRCCILQPLITFYYKVDSMGDKCQNQQLTNPWQYPPPYGIYAPYAK